MVQLWDREMHNGNWTFLTYTCLTTPWMYPDSPTDGNVTSVPGHRPSLWYRFQPLTRSLNLGCKVSVNLHRLRAPNGSRAPRQTGSGSLTESSSKKEYYLAYLPVESPEEAAESESREAAVTQDPSFREEFAHGA